MLGKLIPKREQNRASQQHISQCARMNNQQAALLGAIL
jgi:hypothetical protein